MKKLLTLALIFIASITFFPSCKKEVPQAKAQPELNVSVVGGQVVTGDTIFLVLERDTSIGVKYTIKTAGQIKWLYETTLGTENLVPEAAGKDSFSRVIGYVIPAVNANYSFQVKVTNSEGGRLSRRVVVSVKKYIPPVLNDGTLIVHLNKVVGGDISPLPSRFDLDLGITAGNVSDPIIKASADLHYNVLTFSERVGTTTYPNGMGSKFGTTNLTLAGFNNISKASDLSSFTATLSVITIEVGKVYVCLTNEGKKALILVKSLDAGKDEITFDVKIQAHIPIKKFTGGKVGGAISPLSSRWDLDLNIAAANVSDPIIKASADLHYDALTFSERFGTTTYPNGMGSKFGTTTLDEAGFNNIKAADMSTYTATQSVITIAVGNVYVCITNQNKKALILIKSYDATKDEIIFNHVIQE